MAAMQPLGIAALALWYLMTPPLVTAHKAQPPPYLDTTAPLSQWEIGWAFPTAQDCGSRLSALRRLWEHKPLAFKGSRCVAADDPGLKDRGWLLMSAPVALVAPSVSMQVSTAPISRWEIVGAFPAEKECDAHRHFGIPPGVPPEVPPWARCISAEDLAHAKAMQAPGWLLMKAPHEDVTAPLAQWTSIKDEDFNVVFPDEESCDDYRARLYRENCWPGAVADAPIESSEERERQDEKFLASRCVPDDDRRLNEK